MCELRIAVVSDLHCHSLSTLPRESFLLAGALRRPAAHHPVEALLRLLRESKPPLNANVLVVPGDLANKCCQDGMTRSWDHLLEIGAALGAELIVPVLGNHDVDVGKSATGAKGPAADSTYIARNLRAGFPFADEGAYNGFFSQGFCLLSPRDDLQFVILNSVIDHKDEATAKRGLFEPDRIDALRDHLARLPAVSRIALMHHHPLNHSDALFSDLDVLATGDAILAVLRQHGCQLVIHGHKHVPRLRYCDTPAGRLAVFAAGSFAALLREYGSFTRNLFHIIELQDIGTDGLQGEIYSWEWQMGSGWMPTSVKSSGFPFRTGFGRPCVADAILTTLEALAEKSEARVLREGQVLAAAPELRYLTPAEFLAVSRRLNAKSIELRCDERDGYTLARLYSAHR